MTVTDDIRGTIQHLRATVADLHAELTRYQLVMLDRRQRVGPGAGP